MVVRIFNLVKGMCIGTQLWVEIIGHIVGNEIYNLVVTCC